MEIKRMFSYLFIPHILIGDQRGGPSLCQRLEILKRRQPVPLSSSLWRTASFPPQTHLHFFLSKELDYVCQPTLQLDGHVVSSYQWDCLRAVSGISQLVADSHRENGNTRWLEPGSLNHFVERICHCPGTPTSAVSQVRSTAFGTWAIMPLGGYLLLQPSLS